MTAYIVKVLKTDFAAYSGKFQRDRFRIRQSLRNSPTVVNYNDDLIRLQNFQAPVLLVKGIGSSPWLHQVIDTLAKNIPHSRIVEFPAGHAPHIVSMSEFIVETIKFQSDFWKMNLVAHPIKWG